MTLDDIKKRYDGIQSRMKKLGSDGCYFLCLCEIIEEVNGREVDLLKLVRECQDFGWIKDDYTVMNPTAILAYYTGHYYSMARVNIVPTVVHDNEFTIEKWYNPRTGYTHFKRRFVDTLKDSVTVKEGSVVEYYFFKISK